MPLPVPSRSAVPAAVLAALLNACHHAPDVAALQAQARQYAQRGEYKSAVIQLKNVLQREPRNAGARQQLGATYLDQGDAVSAEKELQRALDLGAPAAQVRPLLGKALLRQGKYQAVLDGFAADAEPDNLCLRAEAQIGLGHADLARALFAQALARDPDFAPALLGQARFALAAGQTDTAAQLVDHALKRHPDDADSLRLRGDVLRVAGKRTEALAAYRHLLAVHPGFAAAHIDVANLLIDAGQFDAARAELNAARASSAPSLSVFFAQAMLDYRQGKPAAALDGLQQILRVAPEHGPSLLLTGAVELALNSLPLAEQHLNQYLSHEPGHALATRLLAQVHVRNNKPEAALALLAPLLDAHPDDVELLALAGEANLRANHNERAAALFERASALQPRQPLLQAAAGLSRLRDGDMARAAAELEHATSLGGAPRRASSLLVMSHLGEHQFDKA
ncbi:MAG TPA: XrtA/PEP-CTERM system TPR-repeat protein PrsT, partial [Telluria sp.]|nr:XrtA/PEP-CTERM system TPR-repeat protein PrsT [Telluria sp.]